MQNYEIPHVEEGYWASLEHSIGTKGMGGRLYKGR